MIEEKQTAPKDYSKFYQFCRENLEKYGGEIRGLSKEFLRKVGAGYLQDKDGKEWLILPYNNHQFFKRELDGTDRMFIKGKRPAYNPLNAFENDLVFVTEGEIDCLSVMFAIGFNNAISVGSAENFEKLPEWLKALNLPAELAVEKWKKAGYQATYFTFSNGTEKVDANNILCSDNGREKLDLKLLDFMKQAFEEFKQQERMEMAENKEKLSGSLSTVFDTLDDYSANLQKNLIKTGYKRLDEMLAMIPGTYLLGALPSMGKSTFALNVAANICDGGESILFISYEQSAKDLAFKMLARYWFMQNRQWNNNADSIPTALQIRLNKYYHEEFPMEEMRRVREEVKAKMENFYVIEGRKETAAELIARVKPYVDAGVKFIVVDYIQLLPNEEEGENKREGLDATLRELQIFQQATNTVVLLISSFNRQNYKTFVSLDSFKESGGLEYTADAILGLQYKLENEKDRADSLKMQELSKQQPRKIQLVCLKSRHGGKFELDFDYYSAHDYFRECAEEETKMKW